MTQKKAKVTFYQCQQDSHAFEASDEKRNHICATLHFALEVGGENHNGMSVDISHPYGTNYDEEIEVGKIQGPYKGPWDHAAFVPLAQEYYRSFVGPQGSGISIAKGATNILMTGNSFAKTKAYEFDVRAGGGGW
ncbi:MAG: hypothetical protein HZA51_03075 [Planctomycetes bacterium]|nr:hypothetical protein [Planctomycetota bacterium]